MLMVIQDLGKDPFSWALGLCLCSSSVWFKCLKTINTLIFIRSFIHSFPGTVLGPGSTAVNPTDKTPLSQLSYHRRVSHSACVPRLLRKGPGTGLPPVLGAWLRSRGGIFLHHLSLPRQGSCRGRRSRQGPGERQVRGCPHPSPHSTKDTRWQTFLVPTPAERGTQHRLCSRSRRWLP